MAGGGGGGGEGVEKMPTLSSSSPPPFATTTLLFPEKKDKNKNKGSSAILALCVMPPPLFLTLRPTHKAVHVSFLSDLNPNPTYIHGQTNVFPLKKEERRSVRKIFSPSPPRSLINRQLFPFPTTRLFEKEEEKSG